MSKVKKILLMGVAYILVAALAVGGTLAYLQDSDSDINVMTLGNVSIEQIEQERDANGGLVEFTQAKPALPAVGTVEWAAEGVDVNGTKYKVFSEDLKNVVDKIVTVKNTGKSDAYVRTIVAIEAPDGDPKNLIHMNWNGTDVTLNGGFTVKIDGVDYCVFSFVYKEALAAGKVSAPSLVQLFLDSATTNEDCALFGETWEVLVLSQAVQTAGFAGADAALDTAFGEANAENVVKWFAGTKAPVVVSDAEALVEALKAGGNVMLNADITVTETVNLENATNIDLNGHTLTVSVLEAKADTNISDGTLVHGKSTYPAISVSAGTLQLDDVDVICPEPCNVVTSGTAEAAEFAGIEVWSGKLVLNNSTITVKTDKIRYSNSVFAIGIHAGEVTMNGGAIVIDSHGSTKAKYDYEGAIFAGSDGDKTVNLNNVSISMRAVGKYLFAWGGHTVLNTTDAVTAADVDARNGGTYKINP